MPASPVLEDMGWITGQHLTSDVAAIAEIDQNGAARTLLDGAGGQPAGQLVRLGERGPDRFRADGQAADKADNGDAQSSPDRDPDETPGADAGGMRSAGGRRALVAAVILLSTASGCSAQSGGRHGSSASAPPGSAPGSAAAPASSEAVPGSPGSAPEASGLHGLRPCPEIAGFRCGMLSVRLDPFGSAPGQLSLRVAVSGVATAPRGVLVLLTGGPGEPGVPFVPRLLGRLGPAFRGYRLVMLDQRGTGASALNCPALQREMGASDLAVPAPDAVRACAAAIGRSRRFFATADTVADLEALRIALGVPRLTLDGVSYGSYVAEQYALAHPDRVSRLVLDSVVPSWNVDPLQLASMRRTATVLRAVCAAQACRSDPARDLAVVVRRYHDGPALLDTLVAMSVGEPSFPGVPAALHAAAGGRPAVLDGLIAQVHRFDAATAGELSQGLHASTLCADLPMPWGGPDTPLAARRAALARAVARLTPAQVWPFDRATAAGNGFIRTCLYWPPTLPPTGGTAGTGATAGARATVGTGATAEAGATAGTGAGAMAGAGATATARATARADLPRVPVLLLAGGRDLSTPLAGARAEAAHAPDGRLFVVPGAGHSVQNRAVGNPALAEVERFLAGG